MKMQESPPDIGGTCKVGTFLFRGKSWDMSNQQSVLDLEPTTKMDGRDLGDMCCGLNLETIG